MTIAGNTIASNNDVQRLYAIHTEGRNRIKLTTDKIGFIAIAEVRSTTNASANYALYRISATGQSRELFCDLPLSLPAKEDALFPLPFFEIIIGNIDRYTTGSTQFYPTRSDQAA
ncbi:MAG: N-acetylmuramoyl-L-alanine amidase CwlD [Sporomusa sp.]|jgi:hypothetical protein|nr:N-acetylmuramoyl-L-alanine amidase CwlD [Sporomusa sp.]